MKCVQKCACGGVIVEDLNAKTGIVCSKCGAGFESVSVIFCIRPSNDCQVGFQPVVTIEFDEDDT